MVFCLNYSNFYLLEFFLLKCPTFWAVRARCQLIQGLNPYLFTFTRIVLRSLSEKKNGFHFTINE